MQRVKIHTVVAADVAKVVAVATAPVAAASVVVAAASCLPSSPY